MIKAIIFDFDGVLGNTYELNFSISKEFYPEITEQDFKDHHNGNVFEQHKIPFMEADIKPYFTRQKAQFTKAHLFPLKKVLVALSKTYKLFVVSSTMDESVLYFLQLDNYHTYFEKILGATTHRSKSAKFHMIFEEYSLTPAECLFVTDTIGDILEANKVGVRTIAVSWGYHGEELLIKYNPVAIVHDEKELLQSIKSIAS